ncbi:unnamed protein product [Mytilus edulis]|uniref:DUF1758 domain-containing protein n=1 Tax=Mytilus edulis TaxID=6550 RepID=A0A8S3ST72_MYTED|nr:unnamed protein product [Mytilus edulis]
MVRSKLPQEVMQLEIQKGTTEKWCVKSLCARLMDYVVAKERSDKSDVQKDRQNSQNNNGANSLSKRNQFQGKFSKFQNGSRQFPNRSTAEALVVNGNDTSQSSSYFDKCRFCQGKHWSDQCPKYKTIDERKAQLKGSCYKCFRNTHKSAECKKGKLCVHCGVLNSHHRSLCPKKFGSGLTSVHLSEEYDHSSSGLSSGVEQSLTSLSEQRETASENVLISSSEIVLMQTAKVEVSNPNDSLKQTTRLLFDSGSQRTYISQKLASKLKLKSEGDEEITIVTFGSEKARTVKTASTSLCIRLNNGKVLKISANIVPVISGTVQRRRLDTSSIENVRHFVKDVELADVIPTQYETSTVDLLIGNDHYFDFILGQRIEIQPGLYILASKLGWIITGRTKENDYSREDIESSFLIMSYTGSNVPKTDTCITSVPNVTDLWNLESIGISDDDNSTEDSRVLEMFKETLEYSNGRYYVTWPWKNDNVDLPVNRDLALSRLKSCIARMRKKPELLEKYNSVIQDQLDKGIVEKWKNINYKDGYASDTNLQEYRFCRVPFGIISSPFLLAATVESHLDKYQSPIARKIKDKIYVDNLISGCTSVAESLEFYSEAKHIFQNASMNLREWVSSSKMFNELLPTKDRTDVFETCVLGHLWNTDIDVIYVKSAKNTMCSGISTKRKTLSELAEVFDPMGFFSPVIVSGKIFLQDLWKRNLKWDDEICGDDKLKWISISSELKKISDVSIPRFIGLEANQNNVKYKLLCFCDASKRAYSTAIYLHQSSGDATKCDLIFSKSRLAPIQGMTIPKLELMAVLIGVRSLKFVKTELKLVIDKTFLWTDSQCVLKWLSTKKSLRVFVENRVQEIKSHKDISFMYVSTKENPADVATRGTLVQKLRSDHLWWHGPSWLKQDENTWEKIYDDDDANQKVNDQFKSELKTSENQKESAFVSENGQEITSNKMPYNIDIKRFSSYHKLIRVTAWIERFISKIRRIPSNNEKYLSVKEIKKAEEMWIQSVQRKSFADVFNSIHTGQKNNLKVQLGVYLDNENLLRCKGRFENADISECAKFPILLPRGETFT